MQVEIFFNEHRLDVDAETTVAETKQINDIFEMSDRQTSYTNSFSLPDTDRNKMIMGMATVVGNTSLATYRLHKISVYRKGLPTILEGIGYFRESTGRIPLHVYSDNIDLFDKIGNETVADLNLAPINHILNVTTWWSSFNRTDYIYPLADYGKLDNDVEINYQSPSLFVSYIWNKIFEEAGYTWEYAGRGGRPDYNPFLKPDWNQFLISVDEGFPEEEESVAAIKKLEVSKNKTSQFNKRTVNYFGNDVTVQSLPDQITEYLRYQVDFDSDNLHLFSQSSQYNRSRIRIKESGFYRITLTGAFFNLNTENVSMFIEKDGHNLYTVQEGFAENQSAISFNERTYLREGDEIFTKVVSSPIDNESYYSYEVNLNMWLDNSVTAVNFSSSFTKVKKKDFIKDICHFLGLIFERKGTVYRFISFEELLDPLARYANYDALADGTVFDDWSGKYVRTLSDNSDIGSYARNNRFAYRYDNSEDTFADSILKIDDDTLDDEKTVVQRPYRAPDSSAVSIDRQLRRCNLYSKELNDDGSIKRVKSVKAEPYFSKVEYLEGTFQYKLAGATSSSTYTGRYPVMSFDDLDFNNVLPNRYAAVSNTLNYGKKFTLEIYLTVLDIHSLDFFKLKYIKQLGAMFYINKVISFTGTGKTKVEALRVRSIEKLGSFSDDFSEDFNI